MCSVKTHSNFLTCLDLKPKSICIRLAVCQCRPGFQAPPVLGKLNWQFSILFGSEGHVAESRKNKKDKQKTHTGQTGNGVRGPCLPRCGPTAPSDGGPQRPPCPAPASRKDGLREAQTAVQFSYVYSSQEQGYPLMLALKLLDTTTTVNC